MTCGVYEFWCGPHFYQGSSKNIEERWKQHLCDLRKGNHGNPRAQYAYDKYGWTDAGVLVECEEQALLAWEQAYIDTNWGDEKYLNCHPVARGGAIAGREITQKQRAAWSDGQKKRFSDPDERERNRLAQKVAQNRDEVRAATKATVTALWKDPTYREKMVQAHMGHKPTPEAVAKSAESRRGKKRSEETKARMSAAQKGKKRSEDAKLRMSAAQKGKKIGPMSDEHKAKIGAANKGRKVSNDVRDKLSAMNKGKKHSEETKAKLSHMNKGRPWTEARRSSQDAKKKDSAQLEVDSVRKTPPVSTPSKGDPFGD